MIRFDTKADLDFYNDLFRKGYENEKIIDNSLKYVEHLILHAKYHLNVNHLKKLKKILQGVKNENINCKSR